MSRHRIQSFATVAVVAALGLGLGAGPAAAAKKADSGRPHAAKVVSKQQHRSAKRVPGGTVTLPASTTAVAISAFPTGGKGSGSEATCGLWSDRLQQDVEVLGDAESTDDRVAASNDLQQDKDNAMDAGCVVID
jgi:hypothetical protein